MNARVSGAALLAATMAALLPVLVAAQPAWTELRGDRFVLRGRLAAGQLSAVACDLEAAARVLRPSRGKDSDAVPAVVAVDNGRDTREWLPQFWERRGPRPLGAYWSGLYGHHIVVRVDARPEERLRRVLHEYAHFLTHLAHPDPPPWLDEGLSEIWAHAAIAEGEIEIGRPVAEHLRRLRSATHWIPVEQLISATALPAADRSAAAMFYAESWALVHYLMFEKAGGETLLERLPDRAVFPTDEELRAYVQGPLSTVKILTTTTAGADCVENATVRSVSSVESLMFRAQALADGERPDAAVPLLHEVLRQEPGNGEAMETLAFVHFVGNRPAEAAALFDQVIAAGAGSHIAYYYRATLAGAVPSLGNGAGPVPEVDYLKRALRLRPGFAPAMERLREISAKVPLALTAWAMRE